MKHQGICLKTFSSAYTGVFSLILCPWSAHLLSKHFCWPFFLTCISSLCLAAGSSSSWKLWLFQQSQVFTFPCILSFFRSLFLFHNDFLCCWWLPKVKKKKKNSLQIVETVFVTFFYFWFNGGQLVLEKTPADALQNFLRQKMKNLREENAIIWWNLAK